MMSDTGIRATEPTSAERVRSVVAAARSLTVTTHGYRCDLVAAHTLDGRGRVVLHLPTDCHGGFPAE